MVLKHIFQAVLLSGIIGTPASAQEPEAEKPALETDADSDPGASVEEGPLLEEPSKKMKRKKKMMGDDGKKMVKLSVDNRIGKKAFAAIELAGFTPNLGFGLRGGYFISPDSIIGLSYLNGSFDTKTQSYNKSLFEVTYKRFFTNSLYLDAGFGYQKWTVDYKVTDNSNSATENASTATLTNFGLVLHVGNQWQWRAFTVGCDWAGYFQPLTSTEKFASSGNNNTIDQDKEERAIKNNTSSTYHLVRLYAGYAF